MANPANEALPDASEEIVPNKRGFRMLVTPSHHEHYSRNAYEDFTADLSRRFSSDHTVFVDVGAHYGYYTLLIGRAYRGYNVISFEPSLDNYRFLQANVSLNGLTNLRTYPFAVSER